MVARLDFSKLAGFEWDKGNIDHIAKHSVKKTECEQVFFNKPLKVRPDEEHSQVEKRFRALGQTNNQRLIFLAFTVRGDKIRVISARDQNKKERESLPGGETE